MGSTASWAYWLDGPDADALAVSPYELLVVDELGAPEVARLRSGPCRPPGRRLPERRRGRGLPLVLAGRLGARPAVVAAGREPRLGRQLPRPVLGARVAA